MLKVIIVRTWEEKRRDGEKVSLILENTYIIMNKKLIEIRMFAVSAEVSESNEKYITGN